MKDQDARWKAAQNLAVLLKLRGQVGVLRQQLASAEAKAVSPADAIASLMTDPAEKELSRIEIRQALKSRYTPLVKTLNLPPEAADKLFSLITQNELSEKDRFAALARGDLDVTAALQERDNAKKELQHQIQSLLGAEDYGQFAEFNREADARATVNAINDQMGKDALSEEQSSAFRISCVLNPRSLWITWICSGPRNRWMQFIKSVLIAPNTCCTKPPAF